MSSQAQMDACGALCHLEVHPFILSVRRAMRCCDHRGQSWLAASVTRVPTCPAGWRYHRHSSRAEACGPVGWGRSRRLDWFFVFNVDNQRDVCGGYRSAAAFTFLWHWRHLYTLSLKVRHAAQAPALHLPDFNALCFAQSSPCPWRCELQTHADYLTFHQVRRQDH